MTFSRLIKHVLATERRVKRHFPDSSLAAIKAAIAHAEGWHMGEIRFVIEAGLDPWQVMHGITARERAIELFSGLRVWDTQYNSGVLIYVLFADRSIEILADRGIHGKTTDETWRRIADAMQAAFAAGQFEEGAIKGITAVAEELVRHFPVAGANPDELSNEVTLL